MKYQYYILLILFSISIQLFESEKSARFLSSTVISKKFLKEEIINRMERVDELRTMKELARELGIKHVYLFGGSAAAWAHYVYWDLEREAGMGDYDESRFDYDYTSIFRSNQDMDIVIDITEGNKHLVTLFEQEMQKRFGHFQGNKSAWEVRPLRFDYGTKDKILNNPDFIAQNSDSHSTGFISITDHDELAIRDFKDWENPNNHFFNDVFNRELHYYRDSIKHKSTQRFQEGLNPEIFSAIRYLTKAFQYELTMDDESLKELQSVLIEFDTERDLKKGYAQTWTEKNGKKLYQNAIDLEFAYKTMRNLGVLELLINIKNNPNTVDSLSWWMNKMPLLTLASENSLVDSGKIRKTAKDLGIEIVAHETKSFAAYESITKSHSGLANVFISRTDFFGENAALGDGFYTKKGKKGAIGSGITIRFKVHPDAIEGIDFIDNGEIVLFKNKAMLEVIPESLNISPVDYFEKLANGEILFDHSDRGIQEKVLRRINLKTSNLSSEEKRKITKIAKEYILNLKDIEFTTFLANWFKLPFSSDYPELFEKLLHYKSIDKDLIKWVLTEPHWIGNHEWIEFLMRDEINDKFIAEFIFSNSDWKIKEEWVELLIKRGNSNIEIMKFVLSKPEWATHEHFYEELLKDKNNYKFFCMYILSSEQFAGRIDWYKQILKEGNANAFLAHSLRQKGWAKYPELIEELIVTDGTAVNHILIERVFPRLSSSDRDYYSRLMLDSELSDYPIFYKLINETTRDMKLERSMEIEFLVEIIKRGSVKVIHLEELFSSPNWQDRDDLKGRLLGKDLNLRNIKKYYRSLRNKRMFNNCVKLVRGLF